MGTETTTPRFNAREFTLPPEMEPVGIWWGHGHTRETDPTQRGWRIRPISFPKPEPEGARAVWLMGRRGVAGCASIMIHERYPGGPVELDVAIYDEDPKTIEQFILTPHEERVAKYDYAIQPSYDFAPAVSGAGLMIVREIERRAVQRAEIESIWGSHATWDVSGIRVM